MNLARVQRSISHIANAYQQKLHTLREDDFQLQPPMGGWSYSEVYSHIFDASLLSLMAMNSCIRNEGENKPTALGVRLVLFFGQLPPGKKYKVPKRMADRVKKISLDNAQQLITDFGLQLAKLYPQVNGANPKIKIKHPRLGYLNARQWLRFIEIHLNHHLKQLKRIERNFLQHA